MCNNNKYILHNIKGSFNLKWPSLSATLGVPLLSSKFLFPALKISIIWGQDCTKPNPARCWESSAIHGEISMFITDLISCFCCMRKFSREGWEVGCYIFNGFGHLRVLDVPRCLTHLVLQEIARQTLALLYWWILDKFKAQRWHLLQSRISFLKTCCALVVPVLNLGGGAVCAWGDCDTLSTFNQIVASFTLLPCNACFIPDYSATEPAGLWHLSLC